MEKINRKILIDSFTPKGVLAFIMNCLQSLLSEFLFGVFYLIIFDYMLKLKFSPWVMAACIVLITVYFIFGIPIWGQWMELCGNTYKAKLSASIFHNFLLHRQKVTRHSSAILTLLQQDIGRSSEIAGWSLVVLFQAILSGTIASVIIGMISWKLLIVILLLGTVPMILDTLSVGKIRYLSEEIREGTEKKLKNILEYVNNLIIIKVFRHDTVMQNHVVEIAQHIYKKQIKLNTIENSIEMIGELFYSGIFKAIILIYGMYLVIHNEIGFGAVMLAISMVEGIAFFMSYIGRYIKSLQKILVSVNRVDEFLQESQNTEQAQGILNTRLPITNIKLEDVSYKYPNSSALILDCINFEFKFPGDYRITGGNGCGKSTLLKLMFGRDVPISGQITVQCDNTQIAAGEPCYVPQQTFILSGELREIIRMGDRSIEDKEILLALDCVGLSQWYSGLPKGLDCIIIEKGKNLSKGQQMRIGIARALVRYPQILFLDEPDANLDSQTMKLLIEKVHAIYKCSIVIVTHASANDTYRGIRWKELHLGLD